MRIQENTTRDITNMGEYLWHKFQCGELECVYPNDAEYAPAVYGNYVIDPASRTVARFRDEDSAMTAARDSAGPGSDDYFIRDDLTDSSRDRIYVAERGGFGKATLVAVALGWESLGPAIRADEDATGVYADIFIESYMRPELLSLSRGGKLEHEVIPLAEETWAV